MPSLREIVQQTHQTLEAYGIADARLEAEVMAMNVMQMPRHGLVAQQEMEVSRQQQESLKEILLRRQKREPLAYILGHKEFYGVDLLVTPDVLIPRPETETLVEHALFMCLMGMEVAQLVIADVGTGTGAIAINLGLHIPAARIYATDTNEKSLAVANFNIRRHNVADRITLCHGDLLEPLPEPVDLIVANLPYIPTQRVPALQAEIQWEPVEALDGGSQGMDLIARLISQAAGKLNPQGAILLEMDPEQMPVAEGLAQQYLPEAETSVERDLAGMDRVFVISRAVTEE
jgi:release factor glutamine methyltransferase